MAALRSFLLAFRNKKKAFMGLLIFGLGNHKGRVGAQTLYSSAKALNEMVRTPRP